MSKKKNSMIFIHSDLDLYGLNPYEFRLYAHIARRGRCFSNLQTISNICKMSIRKAQYGLKALESFGLIKKEVRKGKTDIYELSDRSEWKPPKDDEELEPERKKVTEALSLRENQAKKAEEETLDVVSQSK